MARARPHWCRAPAPPPRAPYNPRAPQVYYVFGFLLLVLAILAVTCAEISIVMCYFQLCSEDYNWWWRSFLAAGSSAGCASRGRYAFSVWAAHWACAYPVWAAH